MSKNSSLVNYFYELLGYVPDNKDNNLKQTDKVIQYLIDCNIDEEKIIDTIEYEASIQNVINNEHLTFENLPDFLWKDSLLEKNIYYLHNELHLNNNANVVDIFSGNVISSNNAIEMKIKYTEEDVLNYFCSAFNIDSDIILKDKEIGAIKYLLTTYTNQFKKCGLNAIDIILTLIDDASNQGMRIYTILDTQDCLYTSIEYLKSIQSELALNNTNKIVWR